MTSKHAEELMHRAEHSAHAGPPEFHGEYPIVIEGLTNRFGSQVVHEDLSLKVRRGEILGPGGDRHQSARCRRRL